MKRIFYIFLITTLVACSAKENAPSNVLSQSEMKSVLWDVLRVQFLAEQNVKQDSTLNVNAETRLLTEKVFTIHKISSKDFDRSYNWYTSHPDQMQELLDSLYTQKQRELNPEPLDTAIKGRKSLKHPIKDKRRSNE